MIARLECVNCDRDDWDSQVPSDISTMFEGQKPPPPIIVNPTVKEMRKHAEAAGWTDVIQRIRFIWDDDLEWATHIGYCPDCRGDI